MALKGQVYIDKCKVFKNLGEALSDCDLVLATCGRIDNCKNTSYESPQEISKWISKFKDIKNLAVLFGREDRGLSNNELLFAHKVFSIKTSPEYPSLNLSHAVSIILYEINKFSDDSLIKEKRIFNLASSNQIYESFVEIEELLIRTGYLLNHTSKAKITKFKKYILRAETSEEEMNILRGIVNQINWFINNSKDD